MSLRVLQLVLMAAVGLTAAGRLAAQAIADADDRPRFFAVSSPGAAPVDASDAPMLRRRVTAELTGVTLAEALREVGRQTGIRFAMSRESVPVDKRVTLRATGITLGAALYELLTGLGLDVQFSRDGTSAAVVRRAERAGAQAGVITGRVTDAETGQGIAGVDLRVAGSQHGTTTSDVGEYVLRDVPPGEQRVTARRIGYRPQTQTATVADGETATLDFALVAQPTQLDEVVTTVTGEQRLRELGHVVGRINADSLVKEAPVSSLSELLNGRVPGLQVFQQQGTVGGEVRVQVRGPNSLLLNSEPIVIIDGVRHTTAQSVTSNAFQTELTSRLNDLNPNDIESIEVVKGPSAATLYGTDAANGVLVITTKRGRPGPARWNVYAKGTATEIPQQQYPDLYWGWGTVNGIPDNPTVSCTLRRLASGQCTQQDSISVYSNPLNDPALTLFGSKPRWQYGANVAGGRQDLRYYFSGDYEDATGPVQMPLVLAEQLKAQRGLSELPEEWREPNALTKLNLRANVNAVLGETADLRVNTGYIRSDTRSLLGGQRSPYAVGAFSGGPTPYQPSSNPAEVFLATSTERTDRFMGNANFQWRPASWLTTRATVGLDLTNSNRYSLARRGDAPTDFFFRDGAVTDDRGRQVATTAELGATATLRHGRLSSRTSVGVQYVRNVNNALQASGRNLPPGGASIGEAATVFTQQTYGETATLGSYLEETIGLNDRLFLTGALRADGASTFGQDYDATVYPKVSASWLISEEPFLPRLPGLDELRFRYAYGASGQQPTSLMAQPKFSVGQAIENGAVRNVVLVDILANRDLRPERVREHELGLDAAALQHRLQLGLTWYRRRTADQILTMPLAPGMGQSYTNLGLTTQHGFEATLTARVLDTRLLSWDVTLQHGLHRTKLVDLGDASVLRIATGGYAEGYPLGARFERPLVGYTDLNSNGIIEFNEAQRSDSVVYLGESAPPESQTLTTVLGLFEGRLRLSALVERRSGFTQLNALRRGWCSGSAGTCRAAVDPSTPLAEQAQLIVGPLPEPADFTRLREVTAALDLPVGLARALRLRSATLALSARNLALWTDFSGPDPESAALPLGGSNAALSSEARGIPQGRSWTLRLDLGL